MLKEVHTIYCLSGLGVDERAFNKIQIENVELIHIPWIDPLKNETLKAYAKRLFDVVKPPENYSVMGVSFGGMIAQEWAHLQKPKNCFLISTISDHKNLRPLLKIGGKMGLAKLMHPKLALICPPVLYYVFGTKERESRRLLKAIISDTDPKFLRWAMQAILHWKSDQVVEKFWIHGTNDHITQLPPHADFSVEAGGHFCVHTHGSEISGFVTKKFKHGR